MHLTYLLHMQFKIYLDICGMSQNILFYLYYFYYLFLKRYKLLKATAIEI